MGHRKELEPKNVGLETLDIYFCAIFESYCRSFICEIETGREAMAPVKYFLISSEPES